MNKLLKKPRRGDVVYSLLSGRGVVQGTEEGLIVLFDNGATKYYSMTGLYRSTHQNSELSYTPWYDEEGNYTATFEKNRLFEVVDENTLNEFLNRDQEIPFNVNYGKESSWGQTNRTIDLPRKGSRLLIPLYYGRELNALMRILMIREFYVRRSAPDHQGPFYVRLTEDACQIRHKDGEVVIVPAWEGGGGSLTFPNKEMAEEFLENNLQLLKDAIPMY